MNAFTNIYILCTNLKKISHCLCNIKKIAKFVSKGNLLIWQDFFLLEYVEFDKTAYVHHNLGV